MSWILAALRQRTGAYPPQEDVEAVRALTANQWRGIAQRTETYLAGYRDRPTSFDKPQKRARWLAEHGVFAEARTVLELGCGCGRNLAELSRAHPGLEVAGVDICPEAIAECGRILPAGQFWLADLYRLTSSHDPAISVDVIFTLGVLGHLEPTAVTSVVQWARARARHAVVLVEEPGYGSLAKGPRPWGAQKATGDYVLWRHDFESMLRAAILTVETLPTWLQAPAATHLYVLRPA